ncbi:phosphatase PAP2 family protein [Natronorubrum sp. DTA28]|uniref:phosphatase PAP2 family protein n=1 Tax=Natronorubrum sp. DTA28 TaxID=3447019 RepID=UPI003F855CAE
MLTEVLTRVAVVVGIMLPISIALFIGRERLETTFTEWRDRLRISGPVLVVLGIALVLNRMMRRSDPDIGFHMTSAIRDIEGEFILIFQRVANSYLTEYFAWIYVYGYTYLLIFPAVAYFVLSDTRMFRRLLTAYTLNYGLGLVLYLLVIAYGPRNILAGELETVLYDHNPEYQHLTREVNRNTNVFPSLHTSLAATVGIFAYLSRDEYLKWFPVAVVLAVSVIISTMYLGIHWAIDVVAGLALAALCVWLSDVIVGRWSLSSAFGRLTGSDEADGSDGVDSD